LLSAFGYGAGCEIRWPKRLREPVSGFVELAELKINRQIRVAEMESSAAVTVTDGVGPLPEDFLEARSVQTGSGRVIHSYSIQALEQSVRGCREVPFAFAIQGRNVIVRPVWSGNLQFDYYQKIPSLTPANPSNWLLETASDVYLLCGSRRNLDMGERRSRCHSRSRYQVAGTCGFSLD